MSMNGFSMDINTSSSRKVEYLKISFYLKA